MEKSLANHPLLTTEEVAESLRLSKNTVSNWLSQGKLQRVKVGRKTFIRRKEVEAIIDGNYRVIAEVST